MKKFVITFVVFASGLFNTFAVENAVTNNPPPVQVEYFQVQHQDLSVMVMRPSIESNRMVTGCHVTVCYPDRLELVSVQCHWDGLSDKGRYSYTLCYRLKGVLPAPGATHTYSLNLADFQAVYSGKILAVKKMGVVPEDGHVSFKAVGPSEMAKQTNLQTYFRM